MRIVRARGRAKIALGLIVLATFAAVLVMRVSGGGEANATDHDRYHQQRFRVAQVSSGDAVRLAGTNHGDEFAVRLIGVDAQTSDDARQFAQRACGSEVLVYLETVPTRNNAGELLAYLFAADGSLINGRLIEAGHAFADRRWDYSYLRTFLQAEEQAASRKRGMWAAMSEDRMPEWRRRWLAEMRKEPWKRREWRRADEP